MKKKLLLGTTALIAAGVVTGGAAQAAEEPITAGVGGYFRSAMGMINQDDSVGELAAGAQSMTIGNDIEIVVSGSTTLDNGITAGFQANIEGNGGATAGGSSSLDERFVFFRGGFGQIRIGQVESARQSMTKFAPSGNYNFGVNSPFFIFANPGNAAGFFNVRTYNDGLGNEDNIKLIYYTPTFNGFRIGVSYSPDDATNGQYGGNAGGALGGLQNNASASAEFSNDFGDFSLRLMGGYETYTLEVCNVNAAGAGVIAAATFASTAAVRTAADQNCDNNPDVVQFGGTISFGEWSIGGGYQEADQVGNTATGGGRDREDWDLGISWWSGPFGVGLQYGNAELDAADNTTDEFRIYELGATYVLGPGVDVGAAVAKGDFDDATAGANLDNEYTEFKMGATLNF